MRNLILKKNLYSTSEVAELLGISRQAVSQKIKSGEIKAQKIGRNYVVAPQDLPHYLVAELSEEKKEMILKVVERALKEYGETFRLLSKE